MVKKIIQISDLHIPNDVNSKSFPFKEIAGNILKSVRKITMGLSQEDIRIALLGDEFHSKENLSSSFATNEAHDMFNEILSVLNQIGKTIVIAGNHDMIRGNKVKMDSITPSFSAVGAFNNVIYLDKELKYQSGYIVDDDIIWVLYSIFDNYSTPNVFDIKEQYPNKKIIGLYHGSLVGARTDIGDVSKDGVDFDSFNGCDVVMCGHIHKYQTLISNGISFVYGGSPYQIDYGENVDGHGFVVWDFPSLKYEHIEVLNDYKKFKITINDYEDVKKDKETQLNFTLDINNK